MKASLIRMNQVVNLDGRVVSIVAQTRTRPLLQVRFWGRDSSGEIVVLEKIRNGWKDVSSEKSLPQYVAIEQTLKRLILKTA